MEIDDIPLCSICNHRHIQGVKCAICGHVGRSQIYQKMRIRANALRSFKLESFYSTTVDNETAFDHWAVVSELRKTIFCTEMLIPSELEFDCYDQSSRHTIGTLGDAFVSVSRWRYIRNGDENGVSALIDRFGVLSSYRRRGFGKAMIDGILSDIRTNALSRDVSLRFILFRIPDDPQLIAKFTSHGLRREEWNITCHDGRIAVFMVWDSMS